MITSVPGSSAYYKGSVISYDNAVKTGVLGVNADDLERYGAVSEAVVSQMAENVRQLLKTDFALATSGIAGPEGGTPDKPVGTVWVAVSTPKHTETKLLHLGNHRINNIRISSIHALGMLMKELNKSLAQ